MLDDEYMDYISSYNLTPISTFSVALQPRDDHFRILAIGKYCMGIRNVEECEIFANKSILN